MNYDPEKLSVSAPVYEEMDSGVYTIAVAGEQANVQDAVTLAYYCPELGLDSVTEMRNFTVSVDADYNVTLSEESAG